MEEIYLNCDSTCFSCPAYDRMIKISDFSQRKLPGSYYCDHCDIYSLCKMGLTYRRFRDGNLKPVCSKCGRFVEKIVLSYQEGQNEKPFSSSSLLIIRRPNGVKYDILQTVKGSYFKDLAEVLLYILYNLGTEKYDIINYDTMTKKYNQIFTGEILPQKVAVKNDKPTTISPKIAFD